MPGKKYISILMDYDNMKYAGSNGGSSNNANGVSDTLTHITQGLQFQKYLKKISGFGAEPVIEDMSNIEKAQQLEELQTLKEKYIKLVNNFEAAGNTLRNGYSVLDKSPDPSYTNKHVTFDGQNGYVTRHGVFKSYDGSGNQFDGINGCPPTSGRKTVSGASYKTILDNNGLKEGSPMQNGQSCGDEGTNVFVTSAQPSGITYSGCYQATDPVFTSNSLTLQDGGPVYNVNSCKWRAVNTGAATFALKDYNETTKKANCYTGSTFVSPTLLGNTYVGTNLWTTQGKDDLSGNFTLPYYMKLQNGGLISIFDSTPNNPQLVKQITNHGQTNCNNVPVITHFGLPTTTSVTFINLINNANQNTLNAALNPKTVPSFSFTVGKLLNTLDSLVKANPSATYQLATTCGTGTSAVISFQTITTANTTEWVIINACAQIAACDNYHLILKENGIIQINIGSSPPTSSTPLYNNTYDVTTSVSITDEILKKLYPLFINPTSNFISSITPLLQNQYIKSYDGKLVLMMQPDGHLVLKTFTQQFKCTSNEVDGKSYGGVDSYALYNFNSPMDNSNIGELAYIDDDGLKHAYIDDDGLKHVYPDTMIQLDNERYEQSINYESVGNNISNIPIQNSSKDYCERASSADVNSGGYVYDNNNRNCWIKNKSFTLKTPKIYKENVYLNVKTPIPNVPISCSDTITEIDSTRWKQYKSDSNMNSNFSCGTARKHSSAQKEVRSTEYQIYGMAVEIINKMNSLQSQGVTLSEDMVTFKTQLQASIAAYNGKTSNDNVINSALTGMMSDSDLIVLQENTRYLFLSIFAVGVMVVALNAIKK